VEKKKSVTRKRQKGKRRGMSDLTNGNNGRKVGWRNVSKSIYQRTRTESMESILMGKNRIETGTGYDDRRGQGECRTDTSRK
jgi:hypothetical protein